MQILSGSERVKRNISKIKSLPTQRRYICQIDDISIHTVNMKLSVCSCRFVKEKTMEFVCISCMRRYYWRFHYSLKLMELKSYMHYHNNGLLMCFWSPSTQFAEVLLSIPLLCSFCVNVHGLIYHCHHVINSWCM